MPKPPPTLRTAHAAAPKPKAAAPRHGRAPKPEPEAKPKATKQPKPATTKPKQRKPRARARRRSRVLIPLVGSAVALAGLFVGVFPTRAVLAQRQEVAAAASELASIDASNHDLEARIEALGTDDEIERIARQDYNLVYPGEEAYALLPAPDPTSIPVTEKWAILRRAIAAASATP